MHKWKSCWIFRRVRTISKSDCYLQSASPSVHPSAWNRSAPTRIFIQFGIWIFSKICREN